MKHKIFKPLIALASTSMVVSASSILISNSVYNTIVSKSKLNSGVSNDEAKAYAYEPVPIYEGYNCSTIISSGYTGQTSDNIYNVSPVDYNSLDSLKTILSRSGIADGEHKSGIFLKSAAEASTKGTGVGTGSGSSSAKGFSDPDEDGYVTITSQNTPDKSSSANDLYWKVPVSKTSVVNNTMKLYETKSGSTVKGMSGHFKFSEWNAYTKLYVLCIISNVPESKKASPVTVNVNVHYTDGTHDDTTFSLYDWCQDNDFSTKTTTARTDYTRCLMHFKNNTITAGGSCPTDGVDWTSKNNAGQIIINQCGVDVDTTKVIKSLEVKLNPVSSSSDTYRTVLTAFGVSGKYANSVASPVKIKTHKTDHYKGKVTWEDDTQPGTVAPTYYYLDVFHYPGNDETKEPVFDVSSKELKASEYTSRTYELGEDVLKGTDKPVGTKFYVRMRSANASKQQTKNSNVDYIITDEAEPIYIKCSPKQPKLKVGKATKVHTLVTNESGSTCKDQDVSWTIPTAYQGKVTIKEATTESNADGKDWEISSTVPGASVTLTAEAHALPETTDTTEPEIGVSAPTFTKSTPAAKSAKLEWSKPDFGSTTNNTYNLEVYKKSDSSKVYSKSNIDKDTTSDTATGLSPLTTYTAKIQMSCQYNSVTYTSDWATYDFTTTENVGTKVELDKSSLTLTLTNTPATDTVTTTVKASDNSNATNQAITWSKSDLVSVKSGTPVAETSLQHTFTPTKAGTGKITAKATGYSSASTKDLSLTVNVGATTANAASNLTPEGFKANWTKHNYADQYIINVYDPDNKKVATETVEDKDVTSCTFTGLKTNVTYKYEVIVKNNNVSSNASNQISVTTPISNATGITVTPNIDHFDTILGENTSVISKVEGQEFEGKQYDATNQNVDTTDSDTKFNISETDRVHHTYQAKAEGDTTLTLTAEGTSVTKQITASVKSLEFKEFYNISKNGFGARWSDLSSYAANPSTLSYKVYLTDNNDNPVEGFETGKSVNTPYIDILGLTPGQTYKIQVSYVNNGFESNKCPVHTVTTVDEVTGITLDKNELDITIEKENTLTATVLCSESSGFNVTWAMDDDIADIIPVATNNVEQTVRIVAKAAGETTIRATVNGYSYEATCKLTVTAPSLGAPDPQIKGVSHKGFTIYWDDLNPKSSSQSLNSSITKHITYKLNVWIRHENLDVEIVVYELPLDTCQITIDKNFNHFRQNQNYWLTVTAIRGDETATSRQVLVKVPKYNKLPLILGATFGSLAGAGLIVGLSFVKAKKNKKNKK